MNQTLPATAVAPVQVAPARRNRLLMDPVQFEHTQRVARLFAVSPLFPKHLRDGGIEVAIANAVLVINMADRLDEDELTVAQNIFFVNGTPGWKASYIIGKANQHGVFRDPIDWEVKGSGDNLSVTAFAVLTKTGKRVAVTCDMRMAKAEGWTKNSKYTSMPEQMLRYRSATFLIRLYCPEVMIGVPATVETELPMKDVTPDEAAYVVQARATTSHNAETGEVIEATAAPAATTTAPKTEAKPKPAEEAKPAQVETKAAAADPAPEEAPPRDVLENLCNSICADLADSGDVDGVQSFYAEQIANLRKFAPDLAAVVDKTAADPTKAEGDGAAQGDLLGTR